MSLMQEASGPLTNIAVASSEQHLEQILALQRRYQARALSPEVQAAEGFVFAEHSLPLLKRMAAELPQAIALADDQVVGYCLSLPLSLGSELPDLAPMFEQLARCAYEGRRLSDCTFFIGGQVCVDRPHRGRGLLARLYDHVRASVGSEYSLCVTEIAARNDVSLRAHRKMGFEPISTYSDGQEQWVVVAWKLR
jgi:GNAT superfamily N-acetyltransferase